MSTPISAMITWATRWLTPGIVSNRSATGWNGTISVSICAVTALIVASRPSMRDSIVRDRKAWWASKEPVSACTSMGIFGRIRPRAHPARTSGSRSPSTSADSIARPETPNRSETNTDNLIPASSSSFSMRCFSRVRSAVSAARYRVRSRKRRIGRGGTKLARTSPCSTNRAIHGESDTSLLRPGTLCMCAAFEQLHLDRVLQHVVHRLPVVAGRLHAHHGYLLLNEPVTKPQQRPGRRCERLDLLPASPARPGHPHTRLQVRLADIQPGAPLDQDLHPNHSFPSRTCSDGPGGRTGETKTLSHLLKATITGARHAATTSGYQSGSRHQCGTTSPARHHTRFSSHSGGPPRPSSATR